jgi:transposase
MLLRDEPIASVAENTNLSWDEVDGIMQRAVNRGLGRRKKTWVRALGIDETSYQKRHKYVTVLVDKGQGNVLDVLPDRKAETLTEWFKTQKTCNIRHIQSISMDMWDPFIKAVRDTIPYAEKIIAFDRFHVSEHLNRGLDKVRAREHKALAAELGSSPLTKTRFQWLANSERTDNRAKKRRGFLDLTRLHLQTSRAWRIKETAATIWDLRYMTVVERNWKRLLGWISRCRIPEMIQVGKTIRHYFWGIINAIRLRANNSMLESRNACIQRIKKIAFGFRNKERFRRSILFHFGGLDMSPSTL